MESKHDQCAKLASEALKHLQSSKLGDLSTAIRKIELVARLINDKSILRWCKFQLGGYSHKFPLFPEAGIDDKYIDNVVTKITELKIPLTEQEILHRLPKSGGRFISVENIEQILERFNKEKKGNDGTYYRYNLQETISSCSNAAATHASKLYSTFSFGDIPRQQFDVIRERVDDLLLELCPDAVEKFMSAYEKLVSSSSEDWSLSLTSCRRVIKAVADIIFPPQKDTVNGRKVGEEQYINRLWAFLDENVTASSDKDLAKAHVNYLGVFIEKLNNKASKGVHASVTHKEAVRAVLYTYLTLGDILEFADQGIKKVLTDKGKIDINTATIDVLVSKLGLTRVIAKEIVKIRVKKKIKSIEDLTSIKGIGPKTVEKIRIKAVAV